MFDLALKVTQSPYLRKNRTLAVNAHVSVWSQPGKALAQIQSRLQTEGATDLLLPSILLEVDSDRLLGATSASYPMRPSVRLRAQNLDLGAFSELANLALSKKRVLGEWLLALDPQGFEGTHRRLYALIRPGMVGRYKEVQLSAYRGSPGVINAGPERYGDSNHIGMRVQGDDVTMNFPTVFSRLWNLMYQDFFFWAGLRLGSGEQD